MTVKETDGRLIVSGTMTHLAGTGSVQKMASSEKAIAPCHDWYGYATYYGLANMTKVIAGYKELTTHDLGITAIFATDQVARIVSADAKGLAECLPALMAAKEDTITMTAYILKMPTKDASITLLNIDMVKGYVIAGKNDTGIKMEVAYAIAEKDMALVKASIGSVAPAPAHYCT